MDIVAMLEKKDLPPHRSALRDAIESAGATLQGLSVFLGRNPSYLHTYLYRGSPRKLDGDDRKKLAQALGVSESILGDPSSGLVDKVEHWLVDATAKGEVILAKNERHYATLGTEISDEDRAAALQSDGKVLADLLKKIGASEKDAAKANAQYLRFVIEEERRLKEEWQRVHKMQKELNDPRVVVGDVPPDPETFRSLPLLSWPTMHSNAVKLADAARTFTDRPPQLMSSKEAYAVRVWSTAMEPALMRGHLVWVDPGRPVHVGDEVVVRGDSQTLRKIVKEIPEEDGEYLALRSVTEINQLGVTLKQLQPNSAISLSMQGLNLDLVVGGLRIRS